MSQNETTVLEGSDAPRAGADLRAARERLGWALADVAAMLRIRPSYLEALEAGRLNNLPGNVYALGFLRSYATALGLDAEEVARRFRAEAGEIPRHSELVFPIPMPERGLPAGALILLGLILVGGAYIGWYRLSGEGKLPAETVPPVPARLAPLAADQARSRTGWPRQIAESVRPPPPASRAAARRGQRPVRAAPGRGGKSLLMPEPPPPPPAPIEEMRIGVDPGRHGDHRDRDAGAAADPPAGPAAPAASRRRVDPANPDGPRVVLRFTGDTWVQVKERGGQALVTRVMKAGETFPVPDRANLVLNTGNAGRVEILVDGAVVPPIGGQGAVRKDVPLDPDQLKAGPVVPVSGASLTAHVRRIRIRDNSVQTNRSLAKRCPLAYLAMRRHAN